jgi:hypothetical protein
MITLLYIPQGISRRSIEEILTKNNLIYKSHLRPNILYVNAREPFVRFLINDTKVMIQRINKNFDEIEF